MALYFNPLPGDSLEVNGDGIQYDTIPFANLHSVNMQNVDLDKLERITLYKYYKDISTLEYVLKGHKLFINKVSSWDDKYENFLLKSNFNIDNKIGDIQDLCNGIFGQSWTTSNETDALWRIYSKDRYGIRIKTNARKLFDALYVDDVCMANVWLGKVKYGYMSSFVKYFSRKFAEDSNLMSTINEIIAESEFMKRKEFEHEEEFRIIFMLDTQQANQYSNFKRLAFNINLDDFIEEYCLDPRLKPYECDLFRLTLADLGVNSYKITRSTLYDFAPHTFNLNKSFGASS